MAGDSKSIVAAVAEVNDLKDAIGDLKKEIDEALSSLNNFGRVGALSVRNLGSEARSLQSTFRDLSRELRRVSTPSGTIGAAATSQALGALTGSSRGGGGGGGGGGPRISAGGVGGAMGGAIGAAGTVASDILGGLVSKIPVIGGALSTGIRAGGKLLSRGASVAATAGLQGGVGFLENAMSRQMGLEQQGRSYLGWTGMLPKSETLNADMGEWWERAKRGSGAKLPTKAMKRGASFGFNAAEMIGSTIPLLPLAGPGKRGRKELEDFVSGTMLPYGTGAGLGTGAGPIQDFTAAMRSGGRSFGDVGQVLSGAHGRFGQGDARQSISLLASIKGAIGTLIQVTGSATKGQLQGASSLHRGLSKLNFASEVTPGVAKMIHEAGISPGGGAPGMVAMLQTMGFGNPDLGRQQNLASQMGIGKTGRFGQKRGYLEAMMAMQKQDPSQAAESLLLTARRIGGVQPMHQAQVMTQLVPGLKLPKAMELIRSEPGGGERKTLLSEIGKTIQSDGKIELPTSKELRAQVAVLEEYHKMVNLTLGVNRKELVKIARALTKVKVALIGPTQKMLLKLPEMIDKVFEKIMKGLKDMGLVVGSSGAGGTATASSNTKKPKTQGRQETLAVLAKSFDNIIKELS